ncbi:hypothetical protein Bca101_038410 [Brassica carinata]
MESGKEAEEYNTSEVDCLEETNQACWGDGDDHTEGHWYIESNPEYVPDDEQEYQEVEPEPLDQYSTCCGPKSHLTYGHNYHPFMRKVLMGNLMFNLVQ